MVSPTLRELRPQLARDLRATARYFRLSASEEKAALDAARMTVHRAAAIYRAIVASLR